MKALDNKIEKFLKCKEILNNLLKKSFDNKLNILEKNTKNQMTLISNTRAITYNITSLAVKLHNQIKSKMKEEKKLTKTFKKHLSKKNLNSPKAILTKKSSRYKTPFNTVKKNKKSDIKTVVNQKIENLKLRRRLTENIDVNINHLGESAKSLTNIKNFNKINTEKSKLNKTYIASYYEKTEKDNIKRPSLISLKSRDIDKNKSNKNILSLSKNDDINKNKIEQKNDKNKVSIKHKFIRNADNKPIYNNGIIINKSTLIKTMEKKKSKIFKNELSNSVEIQNKNKKMIEKNDLSNSVESYKKSKKLIEKNISFNSSNISNKYKQKTVINIHNYYTDKSNTKGKLVIKKREKVNIRNKIISMETNLQKENPLFHDDPLLVTPITDSDFVQGEFSKNKKVSKEINNIDFFKNIGEKNLEKIFEFLYLNELIQLKGCSKYMNKNILISFEKNLNETKNNFQKIKNDISTIQEPKSILDFKFSEGTKKAIELLNEITINNFISEEKEPREDIFFIFQVFFQLINNPLKNIKNDKNLFWEKCKLYFLNEEKGKIGNILENIIKNDKIDISEDNLYNLYKLIKNKSHIIDASYFIKIDSNISLMTFFIKDILNFLGFSSDKDIIKQNGYWTYTKIINSIDNKIKIIEKYKH